MKKYKFVILILLAIAEIVYLIDSLGGVLLFIDGSDPELLRFCTALTLHAGWLLSISLGGIVRLKKREKFSLIKNILMLPIATVIALGIGFFVLFDLEYPDIIAGTVFLVFGLIFIGLMRLRLPAKAKKTDTPLFTPKVFTHVKSKWNYHAAALEYCKIHDKSTNDLSDEETYKILGYANNWILYFIAWLIKHRFFVFYEASQEHEADIISEKCSPSELFIELDNCLTADNIAPELHFFMTQYFEYECSTIGHYEDDYLSVMRKLTGVDYCADYSWDIYRELEKLIDEAYREYTIENESEDIEDVDTVRCDWLDTDISVRKSAGVPKEYVRSCVEHFLSLSPDMKQRICEAIREHLFTDDISDDKDIIPSSNFDSITVYMPYGDESAYVIGGEPSYEEEHGVAVMIRGDRVLDTGYRYDIEYSSPWLRVYVEKYNEQADC